MSKVSNLFSSTVRVIACTFLFLAVAAAQQESRLFGSWQTKDSADSAVVIRLTLNPDGTGTLDNTRIKYSVRGAQLIVNEEGTINNYAFKLNGDEMVSREATWMRL
ncbi:MAG: hypothetical protein ACR2G5_14540 [Pyrinomonadaceae bacterium]